MGHVFRVGMPVTEMAVGKQWTFSPFSYQVWQALAVEGRKQIPSPVKDALAVIDDIVVTDAKILRQLLADDAAELEKAKAENRKPITLAGKWAPLATTLWDKALLLTNRYLEAGSPELQGFYRSHEGGSFIFWLLLKDKQPEATREDCYAVYMDLHLNNGSDGRLTVEQIRDVCSGVAPEPLKNETPPAAS